LGQGLGHRLYELLQTELWLRARQGAGPDVHAPVDAAPVAVS